jgi:ethanolamine ammonia-lyase small subunit
MNRLRDFTMARVGLGRAGEALPTRELLDLRASRAAAGDAVHEALDVTSVIQHCVSRGWEWAAVHSRARDRAEYLRRPDWGRVVDEGSRGALGPGPYDATIIIADGLSARAVHRHAVVVLEGLIPKLREAAWSIAPLTIVEQARVAIGDDIAMLQQARLSVMLIGERPGLSAPDSLGAYLTWSPEHGKTDAERNCISNIRPEGLAYEVAVHQLFALMTASRQRQISGVRLKMTTPHRLPESR